MNTVDELREIKRELADLNRRTSGARQSIATANFLVLTDTPASYAGQAGKFTQVNVGETGLQFALITAEDVKAGTFPVGEYIFQSVVTGIDPTLSQHLATKEYVDTAINVEIDFFLNNTLHDIGGIYYNMRNFESGEAESTFTIGPLGGGDGQALVNFANISGEPGTFSLPSGVFSGHIHAEKTIGNRSVEIYFELYKRTDPGGVETLLVTSELSDPIDAKTGVSLHAAIGTETELNTTDILVVKWFANLGGGAPTTIALYAEGNNVSRFTIPIESSIFNAIYVRQDGTTPLTGDWDSGAFGIYNQSWIHLNADAVELRLGAEVNDYTIQWDGSDAVHTIVAGDFVFLGGNAGFGTATPGSNIEAWSSGDTEIRIIGAGVRVDANTPRGKLTLVRDIPNGTGVANGDLAGAFETHSTDDAGNDGSITSMSFITSVVAAGSVVSDIIFETVHGGNIGATAESMRICGPDVGIGINLPAARLHIWWDTATSNGLTIQGTNHGQNANIAFSAENNAGAAKEFFFSLDPDADIIRITDGVAYGLALNRAGYIGVGLTPGANMTGLAIEAGVLTIKETTTPTDDGDYGKIYTKNDNVLYFQDGAGVEHALAYA